MYGGRRREPPLLFYLIAPMIFLVDIWVVWDSVDMVMEDSVMEDLEATADIEVMVKWTRFWLRPPIRMRNHGNLLI